MTNQFAKSAPPTKKQTNKHLKENFGYCLSTPTLKYEHTPLSVTLSTGNKLDSSPFSFIFLFPVKPLCWCYLATRLNQLSSSTALHRQLSQYITPAPPNKYYHKNTTKTWLGKAWLQRRLHYHPSGTLLEKSQGRNQIS